jgi:hypothetical protein
MPENESFRSPQNEPVFRTVAEELDAAQTAEEFGEAVLGLFRKLTKAMDEFSDAVDEMSD